MTIGEARTLVKTELRKLDVACVVVDEATIERPWGWAFFYQSERYLATQDIRDQLAGNEPFIVNRHTEEIRVTGTAEPIEHYLAEYERSLEGGTI